MRARAAEPEEGREPKEREHAVGDPRGFRRALRHVEPDLSGRARISLDAVGNNHKGCGGAERDEERGATARKGKVRDEREEEHEGSSRVEGAVALYPRDEAGRIILLLLKIAEVGKGSPPREGEDRDYEGEGCNLNEH